MIASLPIITYTQDIKFSENDEKMETSFLFA
jgi:hypothetical protein